MKMFKCAMALVVMTSALTINASEKPEQASAGSVAENAQTPALKASVHNMPIYQWCVAECHCIYSPQPDTKEHARCRASCLMVALETFAAQVRLEAEWERQNRRDQEQKNKKLEQADTAK